MINAEESRKNTLTVPQWAFRRWETLYSVAAQIRMRTFQRDGVPGYESSYAVLGTLQPPTYIPLQHLCAVDLS